MLRDSRSYEVQIIDAVRSVNKALGGTYGTSSAIYKNEFNQYEVQLIDAIKGIGRTLSGKGLSIGGGGGDLVNNEAFLSLSRRVDKLEAESFFRLVDGNVTLKEQYRNLWVPGWLASGGIGNGSGGGGGTVEHLYEIGDVIIDPLTLADGQGIVWDAENHVWRNGNVGGGGGSGTVTGVKMNGVTYQPTNGIVDLGTVLTSFTETDPTVPAWAKAQNPLLYVGTTQVQTSSSPQHMTGILSVKATSSALSQFIWDGDNDAWHFLGNLYATGWVASGDIGSIGGGSSTLAGLQDVTITSATNGQALVYRNGVWQNETIQGGGGSVTSIKIGSSSPYTPDTSGVVSLPAYPTTLPASDVYSWAKASSKPSYSLSEISGTSDLQAIEALSGTSGLLKKTGSNTWTLDTTTYLASGTTLDNIPDGSSRKLSDYVTLATTQNNISGEKTFTTKPVHIGQTSGIDVHGSSYIDLGDARIVYDPSSQAIHITSKSGNDTIGFYADGFVSARGAAASGDQIKFVALTGNQTVAGVKTFSSNLVASGTVTINGVTLTGSSSALSVNKNASFSGISDKVDGSAVTHAVSIQDIVTRLVRLEN